LKVITNCIPINDLRHLKQRITTKNKHKCCQFHRDHEHDT